MNLLLSSENSFLSHPPIRYFYRLLPILSVALFISCHSSSGSDTSLLVFDLEAEYPEKEALYQDYFDVRYIPIKDTLPISDFTLLYADRKEIIGYANNEFLFLDPETGVFTGKFSQIGNGRGEYSSVSDCFYDPQNEEIYVCDGNKNCILIYDRKGNLLRDFFPETQFPIKAMKDAGANLLVYADHHTYTGEGKPPMSRILLFSKQDGSLIRDLSVPEKEIHSPALLLRRGNSISYMGAPDYPMTDAGNSVIFTSSSCDTIYRLTKKGYLSHPYIVSVPPLSEQDDNPSKVFFLYPCLDTPEIQLLYKQTTVLFAGYLYDKQERQIYKLKDCKDSYSRINVQLFGNASSVYGTYAETIPAFGLIRALHEEEQNNSAGKLTEELRNVARNLHEEDNPVLAVYTLKNKNR